MGKQLRNWILPNGKVTHSSLHYIRQWNKLGKNLSKLTNCPIGGYSTHYMSFDAIIHRANGKTGLVGSAQVPVWLIKKLNNGLAKLDAKYEKKLAALQELLKQNKE